MAAMLDVEQPALPAHSNISVINFEELFNMELFGPSTSASQSQESSSRTSSQSPNSSFLSLPTASIDTTIDPSFFDFDIQNSFARPNEPSPSLSDSMTSPASSVPFDFFGSFSGGGSGSDSVSSPDTAHSSAVSPKSMFAIDPSLVGVNSPVIPPPPQAPQHQHRGEADEESDSEDETEEPVIQPIKVGGKGKAARKGTVASGGVTKRTPGGKAVKDVAADSDDWRPTPEEYKKMSSKEKRQLRNKISARNFRVRRKEYISTLEGDIAERDRLIDAIREELGSTKLENVALRQEVDALKRAMLEGRASPVLPPPAPLTPAANTAKRTTRTLAKPNTQKDLPSSPRISGARAFWGGSNSALGGVGGVTPVHATLVPDFPAFSQQRREQQENINPALNLPCFGGVGITTPNPKFPLSPFQQPNLGVHFDAFADLNPFTLKTLDAYRMQLWGRMAREAGAHHAQQQQQQHRSHPQSPSTLSTALRPAFFTTSLVSPPKDRDTTAKYTSPALSAILSGKLPSTSTSVYPTPPSSPPTRPAAEIEPQHAMLASLASQTLLSKMGTAFWDAFARPGRRADWDHDKVRRVLEGKAVVRVVDVDTPPPASAPVDALEESMRAMSIGSGQAQGHEQDESVSGACTGASACGRLFSRTRAAVVGKK